jgi:flavin reductase (DIM6/NTAB) family NADH-FMN oxidoreductase RutF
MSVWKQARPPLIVSLTTTLNDDGSPNASPRTWWTPVSYEPPIVVLSVKPQSDTYRNITERKRFALQLPPTKYGEQILHTAKPLPYGENELDDVGLPWEHLSPDGFVVVCGVPYFLCSVQSSQMVGDHALFFALVIGHGNFNGEGVRDVLVHRSRNVFVDLGGEREERPY